MTKKSKIGLVFKIIMILFLVPIGVVSFAETVLKPFSGNLGGNTKLYEYFKYENILQQYQPISGSGYDWNTIKNKIMENARQELIGNLRVFCLQKGMTLHSNAYVNSEGQEIVYKPNGHYEFKMGHGQPSPLTYYFGLKITNGGVDIDLSQVPKTGGTFGMAYAASFYGGGATTGTNQSTENTQKVIWANTNNSEKTPLYYANLAYEEYAKILQSHKVEDNSLEIQERENAGSYLSGDYCFVGPFYIGNYAYAEGKENSHISEFSGKNQEHPNLLAGIVKGTITISGEKFEFDGENISVYYGNGGAGIGNNGGYAIQGTTYIKTPDSMEVREESSQYPRPESTFYIKIHKSKVTQNARLTNISFSYRQTEAIGKGKYLTLTASTQEWRVQNKPTQINYKCQECGAIHNGTYYNRSEWTHKDNYMCNIREGNVHNHKDECFGFQLDSDGNLRKTITTECVLYQKLKEIIDGSDKTGIKKAIKECFNYVDEGRSDSIGERVDGKTNNGEERTVENGEAIGYIRRYDATYENEYNKDNPINKLDFLRDKVEYLFENGSVKLHDEIWFTDEKFNDACNYHCHTIYCFIEKPDISGSVNEETRTFRGKNFTITCGDNFFTHYQPYVTRDKNNNRERGHTEYLDGNKHIHTMECYGTPCDGQFYCTDSPQHYNCETWYYKQANSIPSVPLQPLLIIQYAKTGIKKASASLNVDIKLNTAVSIEQHIDILTSADGKKKYILNDIPTATGIKEDRWVNVNPNADEAWKKANVAVVEVGDKISYMLTLTNASEEDVAVQIQNRLPQNIEKTIQIERVKSYEQEILPNNSVKTVNSNNKTLKTSDFPTCVTKNGQSYLHIKENSTIRFLITVTVETGQSAYDTNQSKVAEAKILGTYRAVASQEYQYAPIANMSNKKQSSDYFICKKYNVIINQYISHVLRSNGDTLTAGEYVVDNNRYGIGNRNTANENEKRANPVYIENGDIVIYTIEIMNNANSRRTLLFSRKCNCFIGKYASNFHSQS